MSCVCWDFYQIYISSTSHFSGLSLKKTSTTPQIRLFLFDRENSRGCCMHMCICRVESFQHNSYFFFKAFELLLHQSQSQGIIQHRVHKHQRTYLHIPPNSISQTFSNTYLIFRTGKGGEKEEADVPPATHVSFCCGLASSGFIAASQKYVCFFYWKGKCWNVTSKLKRESPLK